MRIVVGLIALMAKEVCLFGKLTFQKNTFDCLNEQGTRIGPFYRYVSMTYYYILNTPYLVSCGSRFIEAEMERPMTFLVSAGSIIPSSQSLAVE